MGDAFSKTKAERDRAVSKLKEKAIKDLGAVYEGMEDSVYAELTRLRSGGKGYTMQARAEALKRINSALTRFRDRFFGTLSRAARAIAKVASRAGFEDARALKTPSGKLSERIAAADRYVAMALEDTRGYVAAQSARMSAQTKEMLRREAAQVVRKAIASKMTHKAAAAELMKEVLAKEPKFQFIDRAGRRWDNRRYFDMLANATMANLEREAYVETLVSEGVDLARITNVGSEDPCKGWEDRVISLTGETPGYPTLQDSIDSGQIWHPYCRHNLVAYKKEA